MTDPALPATSASIAQRDELVVAAEATVIPTLLALHGRQRQALEALRVCIAALGETAPAGLLAQEAELAAALAATETALRGYGFAQVDAGGGDIAGRAGEASAQGAIVNGGTFYGTVIGYQENQAGTVSSWACYVCGVDNPPNTLFCFKCSAQLVRICPECRQNTSMLGSKICGNCGYHFDIAVKRINLRSNIDTQSGSLKVIYLKYAQLVKRKTKDEENAIVCASLFVFLGVCFIIGDGFIVAKVLVVLILLVNVVIIVAISMFKKERNKKLVLEMGVKIHQIEQSIIQFQRALEETNIRKV